MSDEPPRLARRTLQLAESFAIRALNAQLAIARSSRLSETQSSMNSLKQQFDIGGFLAQRTRDGPPPSDQPKLLDTLNPEKFGADVATVLKAWLFSPTRLESASADKVTYRVRGEMASAMLGEKFRYLQPLFAKHETRLSIEDNGKGGVLGTVTLDGQEALRLNLTESEFQVDAALHALSPALPFIFEISGRVPTAVQPQELPEASGVVRLTRRVPAAAVWEMEMTVVAPVSLKGALPDGGVVELRADPSRAVLRSVNGATGKTDLRIDLKKLSVIAPASALGVEEGQQLLLNAAAFQLQISGEPKNDNVKLKDLSFGHDGLSLNLDDKPLLSSTLRSDSGHKADIVFTPQAATGGFSLGFSPGLDVHLRTFLIPLDRVFEIPHWAEEGEYRIQLFGPGRPELVPVGGDEETEISFYVKNGSINLNSPLAEHPITAAKGEVLAVSRKSGPNPDDPFHRVSVTKPN